MLKQKLEKENNILKKIYRIMNNIHYFFFVKIYIRIDKCYNDNIGGIGYGYWYIGNIMLFII